MHLQQRKLELFLQSDEKLVFLLCEPASRAVASLGVNRDTFIRLIGSVGYCTRYLTVYRAQIPVKLQLVGCYAAHDGALKEGIL